jgi:hypothetical protein
MCVYAPTTSIIELHAPPPEGVVNNNNNKRGHTQTAILCVWSRAWTPTPPPRVGGRGGPHSLTQPNTNQPNQRTRESLAHDNSRRAHPTVHASIMMMMMMMMMMIIYIYIYISSSSSSITSAHTSPHNLRPCHTTTHVVVVVW